MRYLDGFQELGAFPGRASVYDVEGSGSDGNLGARIASIGIDCNEGQWQARNAMRAGLEHVTCGAA